ncbi:MAG: NAD-dependent epimerase/dehydratase family protein [Chlorobium phaeovibrioides]|nr:NAD-dependent epimerase/dehydratase family protein [Chlorobium phaeovibrioides]
MSSLMRDMRILVTGSKGFIGKNLVLRLNELQCCEVIEFVRADSLDRLPELVSQADAIIHLAGENRPKNVDDFALVNTELTRTICNVIRSFGRDVPLIYVSSTQAELDNLYGKSKRAGEVAIEQYAAETGNTALIYRLPGVFGKWCRPNYNSVVATFCYNFANDLPIQINDPGAKIRVVYVDDVISEFISALSNMGGGVYFGEVLPEYFITLGDLAEQINAFKNCRTSLLSERVGTGLTRALYATYVSYLPTGKFAYDLTRHGDERGVFVEMLKTADSGQFSYFTAHPGVTRGGHYHHTKSEKFLVIKGDARFGFRHVHSNESYEIFTSGDKPQVVETVPGWAHDITNVGSEEMIVMLWANEIFDRDRPDTVASKVLI